MLQHEGLDCTLVIVLRVCAENQDVTKQRRAEARFNKDLAKIDNISSHHSKMG